MSKNDEAILNQKYWSNFNPRPKQNASLQDASFWVTCSFSLQVFIARKVGIREIELD
jgi:hypothetical protein